ncbi:MAG: ATP-binding protein [Candidatus Njordarchaeia archaeon]
MAKCIVCGREAVVKIEHANASFCAEHFKQYYERKILRVLKGLNLENKCILVALSGGKDSVSLLYALNRLKKDLNYNLKVLHIQLGIGLYSKESLEVSKQLAEKLNLRLIIFDLEKNLGWTIPEAVKVTKKKPCSLCGIVKRWVMNKVALEENCEYVATGHNVDDIDAIALKAMLTYRPEDIERTSSPILEPNMEVNLVGKLRPQFYLTEKENMLYAQFNGLPIVETTCPLASRSKIFKYKGIWQEIDKVNPVGKINFAKTLVEISKKLKENKREVQQLRKCVRCGMPTYGRDVCAFCKINEKVSGVERHN